MRTDIELKILSDEGKIEISKIVRSDLTRSWIWTVLISIARSLIVCYFLGQARDNALIFIIGVLILQLVLAIGYSLRSILMARKNYLVAGIVTMIILSTPGGACTMFLPDNDYKITKIMDKDIAKEEIEAMNLKYSDDKLKKEQAIRNVLALVVARTTTIRKEDENIHQYNILKELFDEGVITQKHFDYYSKYVSTSNIILDFKNTTKRSKEKLDQLLALGEITLEEYQQELEEE